MNLITKLLLNWQLPKLLAKQCGARIPGSGERASKVNCYVIALDHDSDPYFVATGYENNSLLGLRWNDNSYSLEDSIPIESISEAKLRITHYYGPSRVIYTNIYGLLLNKITKWPYIKILTYKLSRPLAKKFFNIKKLVTKQRIDMLKFMMADQLDRQHDGISSLELMVKLYSIKWVLHPSGDQQYKKLEFFLNSLVDTEDLKLINREYVVTPKAIATIEKYEEEERRHRENANLQRIVVILTLILALLALVQSGLVRLPPLVDFAPK